MEFLKAFFGDKAITYDELVQAINAYNCDEKNKEKLIKMVNLNSSGICSLLYDDGTIYATGVSHSRL